MGFDSESSCEEPDAIKKEATDEECIELTTDDNESPSKQYEKIHICAYEGCNKKFSRPSKLQAHLCYHTGERAFKCKHEGCDKSYSRPQHLRRHIATSHSKEAMYKKLLRCPYPDCMKELSNQQNLKKHYYRKHERKQPFTCEYCDKGFPKHQQLKQHLYQHTGIPPFSCSECNVGFTKIGDLNRHNRGHKTYTCSFADCGIVLKAWTHMRTHIKLKHPSEFPCDNCGRTFRTKSRLKIHATIHKEPDEREIFSCTYPNCPRFYFKKSNLTHHIKSSHEGKKFECAYEDCGAKLCSKQKLEQHIKLHTTNRPKPRRRNKSKKKRYDTGIHKQSMAVKLSGIKPCEIEKLLLNTDSDKIKELNVIPSSPNHTVVIFEKEDMIIDRDESLKPTNKDAFSKGDVKNLVTGTVVSEKEHAHCCSKAVILQNCTHDSLISFPMKEIELESEEYKANLINNESDRLSSKTGIILTVPLYEVNEREKSNLTSEQSKNYHEGNSRTSHSNYLESLKSNENNDISSISHEVDSHISHSDTFYLLNSNENTNICSLSDEMNSNNSHSDYSKSLNSNENINISSVSNKNDNMSMNLDENVNNSSNSNENFSMFLTLEETSNISLFELNLEPLVKCDSLSMLNVPFEGEIYSTVMCINSDHGTLLQEVDAAPTDKRKRKSVAEDSKLFQSSSDACSEREDIEKEHNKESGDFTETKSCPPSNDSLQANQHSKLSRSSKRNVSNRKLLAKFKKLKTAELSAKRSSTPSNCLPHIPSEQEDKINSLNTIFIQKEESLMALDTIYKEDKYIQDCLRVIDAKDLKLVEERSKTSDGIKLHHMDSEPDDIQNVINNRESCGTKVDKNITGILDTSSSLKHLFLRRKQKSLDQIVHSLRSVLENKLGGNNRSIPSSVNLDNVVAEDEENNKSKNSEAEYSKSCQESSNVHSLLHKHGEFCVGDSKLPECSVVGSNKNLRDLCALSQKAILKRTDDHVNSPTALREDTQVGYAKQQDIWRMSIHGDMTIKKWLQVMQKAMEDVYPYLKQHI